MSTSAITFIYVHYVGPLLYLELVMQLQVTCQNQCEVEAQLSSEV